MDHWNSLIKIMRDETLTQSTKDHAAMLLRQFNTASGSVIMKPEIEQFVKRVNPSLMVQHRN